MTYIEMEATLKSILEAASSYRRSIEENFEEALNYTTAFLHDGKISQDTYNDISELLGCGDDPSLNIRHIVSSEYIKESLRLLKD